MVPVRPAGAKTLILLYFAHIAAAVLHYVASSVYHFHKLPAVWSLTSYCETHFIYPSITLSPAPTASRARWSCGHKLPFRRGRAFKWVETQVPIAVGCPFLSDVASDSEQLSLWIEGERAEVRRPRVMVWSRPWINRVSSRS